MVIHTALKYEDVHSIVVEVLVEVQATITDAAIEIDDDTRPLDEIEMFDSQLAEDTTVTLLERLGVTTPDVPTPFRVEGRAATVAEVTRTLAVLVGIAEAS